MSGNSRFLHYYINRYNERKRNLISKEREMKKIVLTLAMLLTMCMGMSAENHETNKVSELCNEMKVENFDFNVNFKRLAMALDLNDDQMDSTENVMQMFANDMLFAYNECNNVNRDNVIRNTVKKHVKYISYILTKDQQKTYLKLLNTTLNNRGFDTSKF